MVTESQPVVNNVEAPDLANLSPLEAFYHLFTLEQHSYETDAEFRERKVSREVFTATLNDAGLTPAEYLAHLQSRYGNN